MNTAWLTLLLLLFLLLLPSLALGTDCLLPELTAPHNGVLDLQPVLNTNKESSDYIHQESYLYHKPGFQGVSVVVESTNTTMFFPAHAHCFPGNEARWWGVRLSCRYHKSRQVILCAMFVGDCSWECERTYTSKGDLPALRVMAHGVSRWRGIPPPTTCPTQAWESLVPYKDSCKDSPLTHASNDKPLSPKKSSTLSSNDKPSTESSINGPSTQPLPKSSTDKNSTKSSIIKTSNTSPVVFAIIIVALSLIVLALLMAAQKLGKFLKERRVNRTPNQRVVCHALPPIEAPAARYTVANYQRSAPPNDLTRQLSYEAPSERNLPVNPHRHSSRRPPRTELLRYPSYEALGERNPPVNPHHRYSRRPPPNELLRYPSYEALAMSDSPHGAPFSPTKDDLEVEFDPHSGENHYTKPKK